VSYGFSTLLFLFPPWEIGFQSSLTKEHFAVVLVGCKEVGTNRENKDQNSNFSHKFMTSRKWSRNCVL